LVLTRGHPTGGTASAVEAALESGKPLWIVDLDQDPDPKKVWDWMDRNFVRILNVAGPRESTSPGIYEQAKKYLQKIFQ